MRICTALDADLLTWRRIVDLITELDLLGLISVIVKHGGRYGRQKQIVGISAKEQAPLFTSIKNKISGSTNIKINTHSLIRKFDD